MKNLIPFTFVLLFSFSACCQVPRTKNPQKPNIVLIMADDMGYSDIGCYGGEINTPNLDRLAGNGARFSQFYNGARCCPSRASLLTGLYPHQTGIGYMVNNKSDAPGYLGELNDRCVTIPEILKQEGYGTYMSGKWHLTYSVDGSDIHNWPLQKGFDQFYGTIIGAGSYYNPNTLAKNNTLLPEPKDPDFYYTEAIGDNAVTFVKEHTSRQPKDPFFLYMAFTAPHWPLHAPEKEVLKYKGRYDDGWDSIRVRRYKRMKELGIINDNWEQSPRDSRISEWGNEADKDWQKRRMEVYAAQIDIMDRNIGKLIGQLESDQMLDNTLIIFLADNGGCAEELTPGWLNFLSTKVGRKKTRQGKEVQYLNNPSIMPGAEDTYQSCGIPWANVQNTPFRYYKHYMHEGGISTPLIMHWPDGMDKKGEWINAPGQLPDIMATIMDVTSSDYPKTYQNKTIIPQEGYSLFPLINGKPNGRNTLYWEHGNNRAVREGKWKLVATAKGDWELYDMEKDRTEIHNLRDQHPDLAEKLEGMWNTWAWRTHVFPRRNN